jgi:hypothetical protein
MTISKIWPCLKPRLLPPGSAPDTDPVSHAIFSLFSRKHTFCIPLWRTSTFPPKPRKNNHFIDETIKYFKQFVLLLATHAQFGRHTIFCMSEIDYPRAFVSFPRIAGSGNEIVFLQDWTEVVTSRKFVVFREGKLETLLVSCIIFEVEMKYRVKLYADDLMCK